MAADPTAGYAFASATYSAAIFAAEATFAFAGSAYVSVNGETGTGTKDSAIGFASASVTGTNAPLFAPKFAGPGSLMNGPHREPLYWSSGTSVISFVHLLYIIPTTSIMYHYSTITCPVFYSYAPTSLHVLHTSISLSKQHYIFAISSPTTQFPIICT